MFFKKFEDSIPVGYLITEENLRYILDDVDFDKSPPPKYFESRGYAVVIPSEQPSLSPYQIASEFETQNEDGTWQQQWNVIEVSDEERAAIFDAKLKDVTDYQVHLLSVYAQQLADPAETPSELVIIQKWIDATKSMDLSDPFNVVWPTEDMISKS